MQTTNKDKEKPAASPPPPPVKGAPAATAADAPKSDAAAAAAATPPVGAPNPGDAAADAEADEKISRAKREFFVIKTVGEMTIQKFETRTAMLKYLNGDATAPKFGEFEVIVGSKLTLKPSVQLG